MSSSAGQVPNFGLILIPQLMNVIGDAIAQRNLRVYHHRSKKRFLISMVLVSCIQVFVFFLVFEFALPQSVVGQVEIDGVTMTCYRDSSQNGIHGCIRPSNTSDACDIVECPRQGPISMFVSIVKHPGLLLNGILNIFYYVTEAILYHEPLGLVFIVMSSLFSSFLVRPITSVFGVSSGEVASAPVYVLGIIGAALCIVGKPVERPVPSDKVILLLPSQQLTSAEHGSTLNASIMKYDSYSGSLERSDTNISWVSSLNLSEDGLPVPESEERALLHPKEEQPHSASKTRTTCLAIVLEILRLVPAFVLLAIVFALWFVTQKFFNDDWHLNLYGYTSMDQVLLPLYMYPYLMIIDAITPIQSWCYQGEDQSDSFSLSVRKSFREASFVQLFIYRLLLNGRACIYFYLAVNYDLSLVYLELTLVRIVLSWVMSSILLMLVPRFIDATKEEREANLKWWVLMLRIIGSGCVLGSILILRN